jgi:2-(1,2-epoxy-1,2-dihydrophenyl)acetyl-CoA isomerase
MTGMRNGRILLERREGVMVMTLNHPASLNAFGFKLKQDFTDALDEIERGDARCLVITGAGRAFSSGANLNDPDRPPRDREAEARGEAKSELVTWYNPMFLRLRALDIPIVAAVNGLAAGVGMSLAMACDLKVAGRSAYFLQAFARIGLAPDGGASYTLPRLIGLARAMELALLAEKLPAETALEWGLINRVVDDAALMDSAMELAQRLAKGPRALGIIRRMFWDSLDHDYPTQLAHEAKLQTQAGISEDYQEGVAAFREKRTAKFKGR